MSFLLINSVEKFFFVVLNCDHLKNTKDDIDQHMLIFLFLYSKDNDKYCPTSFDSILCWPRTLRGTQAYLPCLEELQGVHYDITSKFVFINMNFAKHIRAFYDNFFLSYILLLVEHFVFLFSAYNSFLFL